MNLEQTILVHSKVRDWLMSEWDPIGVSGCPEAFNEYYGYAREIADLLIAGESEEELARHLLQQERESMGLAGDAQGALRAAARLKTLYNDLSKDEHKSE